jgi:hypothetical protein
MANKSLFSRGPFLMGLTMLVIGILILGLPFVAPGGYPPEFYERIGEMSGWAGGALIGVGLVAMVIGLIKRSKDG